VTPEVKDNTGLAKKNREEGTNRGKNKADATIGRETTRLGKGDRRLRLKKETNNKLKWVMLLKKNAEKGQEKGGKCVRGGSAAFKPERKYLWGRGKGGGCTQKNTVSENLGARVPNALQLFPGDLRMSKRKKKKQEHHGEKKKMLIRRCYFSWGVNHWGNWKNKENREKMEKWINTAWRSDRFHQGERLQRRKNWVRTKKSEVKEGKWKETIKESYYFRTHHRESPRLGKRKEGSKRKAKTDRKSRTLGRLGKYPLLQGEENYHRSKKDGGSQEKIRGGSFFHQGCWWPKTTTEKKKAAFGKGESATAGQASAKKREERRSNRERWQQEKTKITRINVRVKKHRRGRGRDPRGEKKRISPIAKVRTLTEKKRRCRESEENSW